MVFEFLLIFLLLVLLTTSLFKRKTKSMLIEKFPRVKHIFIRLPLLDGYISLIRLRCEGLNGLLKLAKTYGRNLTIPIAHTEAIVTTDPDIIQKLLKSTEHGHLNKIRDFYDVIFSDGLRDGLVPSDVNVWSPHRKVISRAFTYKSFPNYSKMIHDGAIELSRTACTFTAKDVGSAITLKKMTELINHTTVKVTAEITMGVDVVKEVPNAEFLDILEAFKRAKDICADRLTNPLLLIKPIWLLHSQKRELNRLIQKNRDFCLKLANIYRTKRDLAINPYSELNDCNLNEPTNIVSDDDDESRSNETVGCPMEEMIKAKFSDKEIADEVAMLMAAGHDTTVTSLHFLIFNLAVNRKHQQMCHAEVDKMFGSKSGQCFDIADYSQLKYLERCILESLRITPTIPAFGRKLDAPLQISEDFSIAAGTNVVVPSWLVHRDPEIYPHPDVFDPDRFLPENIKQRHSYSYLPFSLGARNCVGWKVALLEIKILMVWILKEFEFVTTDKPEDFQLVFGLTVKPEREYNVMLKRRDE